jgi:hypothetical protein
MKKPFEVCGTPLNRLTLNLSPSRKPRKNHSVKSSSFFYFRLSLLFLAVAFGGRARAAGTPTLSFDVTARVAQISGGAARTTAAKVLLRGERARIESSLGGQKIVVLWQKPYVYRLLPSSKSGVRYKASTPVPELGALSVNWPQLMSHPSQIRASLEAHGARKVGSAKLDGVAAEVYAASQWNGKKQPMKLWLRRADALPLRLETRSGDWKITVNWRHYVRNPKLAASLFAVPKGYRIRDAEPPRSMF